MKPTHHTAGESTALPTHVVDYGTYQDWHTHAPVEGTPYDLRAGLRARDNLRSCTQRCVRRAELELWGSLGKYLKGANINL